jgi:DNA-binding response OmpR family regulator
MHRVPVDSGAYVMERPKNQLGRILLKRKLVSAEQLEEALRRQRSMPPGEAPLASVLTDEGMLDETDAIRALSEQFGMPGLDLSRISIDLRHLDCVPREVAERRAILPVLVEDEQMFLAMADPLDRNAVDELEFVTGLKVRSYVAVTSALRRATVAAYDAKEAGAPRYAGPRAQQVPEPQEAPVHRKSSQTLEAVRHETSPPPASADVSPFDLDIGELDVQPAPVTPRPSQLVGKRVLVVEDDHEIRKMVVRIVTGMGHSVQEVERGSLAFEAVRTQKPDLIILDAMLPEVHGFEIAKRLKSTESYAQIPILMVSAVHRGWRIAEDAKSNLKVDAYLEKPFRVTEMSSEITRLLSRDKPTVRQADDVADEARRLIEASVQSYQQGRMQEAIAHLRKATAVDPLAFRPHYHLGLLLARDGTVFEAVTELERAVELQPRSFAALKNLALVYEQAGFRNQAIEVWERCIQAADTAEVQHEIRAHLMQLL